MKCPFCGERTRTYQTRVKAGRVLRRRICRRALCAKKFRTVEQPVASGGAYVPVVGAPRAGGAGPGALPH